MFSTVTSGTEEGMRQEQHWGTCYAAVRRDHRDDGSPGQDLGGWGVREAEFRGRGDCLDVRAE